MPDFLSGRTRNIKVGVSEYNDAQTVLEVTGRVGVGTTNATAELFVQGNQKVTGVITAAQFIGNVNSGVATITTLSGTTATYATGNFTTGYINTGVVTSLSGDILDYNTGDINILSGTSVKFLGISTLQTLDGGILSYGNAYLTNLNAGVGVVTSLSGKDLNYNGIGSITSIQSSNGNFSGVVTATNFYGNLIGNANTATYATYAIVLEFLLTQHMQQMLV